MTDAKMPRGTISPTPPILQLGTGEVYATCPLCKKTNLETPIYVVDIGVSVRVVIGPDGYWIGDSTTMDEWLATYECEKCDFHWGWDDSRGNSKEWREDD